jgi:hypothetical protein
MDGAIFITAADARVEGCIQKTDHLKPGLFRIVLLFKGPVPANPESLS